jgi:ankyrin repeat protein
MKASQMGRTAIVQALIGAGADINLQDKVGGNYNVHAFSSCDC